MTRNRKLLRSTLLAAVAAGVMVAAPGSAHAAEKFTAAQYPAILHGVATAPHAFTFSGGRKFECASVTTTGELVEASEKVKLSPKYSECKMWIAGIEKPAGTVASCAKGFDHYDNYFGRTITVCAEGYTHHVIMYNNAEQTEVLCKYDIATTEGEKVKFKNLGGTGGIEITYEVTGISYTRIAGSALLCGPESSTTTYTGTSVVTAKNLESKPIGFDLG